VVSNAAFLMAAVIGLTTCMPSLVPSGAVTGVAAGTAGSAARPEILPPSFRDALGDDAFSAPPSSDASGPAAAEPTTATEVSTSTATTPETSVAGPAVASGPGATGSVADPTGLQDLPAGPPDPAASDRGATVPSLDLNLESARPLLPMAPARAVALRAALDAWHLGRPTVGSVAVSVAAGGERWHGASGPVAVPGAAASGAASGAPPGVAPGASAGVSPPAFGVGDPFPIASLTKTFTLALVLREVERGTIDLDAPVPPLPGIGELNERLGITPRQLLQHASGLVNYTNADEFTVTELTPADAVAISMRTPLRSAPGTKVYYANTNYLYLGLLVEHVTGRRYPELVADMIERIRLAQSAVDVVRGKGWVGFSSGGMSSSLPDLAAWLEALYSPGVILAPESIQMISALTDLRLALGMWPICPCWTDPTTGERGYTAIGHQAEFGAINRYPKAGISVAVRIDPPSPEAGALAADLGRALAAALASPAVPLSSPA
jgi:CubicO group peptidase (beta-lactamase class C family)